MRKPPVHRSFWNAFSGIFSMLTSERNFQIEIFALVVNVFLIFFLKLNYLDAAIILISCFAVLSAEIFNTAIEKICDLIQPNFDERIKFVKDVSAGAVLVLAISSVVIGILIYKNYVLELFQN